MLKRWGLWVVALALVLAAGWRVASVVWVGRGTPVHDLPWIVYGYDRVWYRDRPLPVCAHGSALAAEPPPVHH